MCENGRVKGLSLEVDVLRVDTSHLIFDRCCVGGGCRGGEGWRTVRRRSTADVGGPFHNSGRLEKHGHRFVEERGKREELNPLERLMFLMCV